MQLGWIHGAVRRFAFLAVTVLLGGAFVASSTLVVGGPVAHHSGRSDGQAAAGQRRSESPSSLPLSPTVAGSLTTAGGAHNVGSPGTGMSSAGSQMATIVSPASTSSTVGLWAADWGAAAARRTAAGWQAAARNESLLIGQPGVYQRWIPQLHAWNPRLTILAYDLGPYLQRGSPDFNTVQQQHPDWFAHDAHGRLINLPMFPANYLMEMSNAGYRGWHAQQLAASVSAHGFDGAMDDSMGTGALGSYSSGAPVNPASHQPWTATPYLHNAVLMLNTDKAALRGKYLAFNGLISGTQYALDSHILATSQADAGISELFLRQPTSSATSFPSTSDVQASVAMMSDMAAHGKAFLGWTKVWCNASSAQVAKWEQFALGVYLLGRQAASYLDFMPSHQADNTVVAYPNLRTQLGAAAGAYRVAGSTFTRTFAQGTVTVNVATRSVTIRLS
jgi:phage baseplate assembly protein gpV